MALSLTIASTDRTAYLQSFHTARAINRAGLCDFVLQDAAATWAPAAFDRFVLADGATRIFSGYILSVSVTWAAEYTGCVIRGTAADYAHAAQRQMFNTTFTSKTVKSFVEDIVAVLDDDFAVTVHPSQATGDTIDTLTCAWAPFDQVLNSLSTLTGWIWYADANDRFRMVLIGSLSAPQTFNEANRNVRRFEWDQSPAQATYRNEEYLEYGPNAVLEKTDHFDGDDSTRDFDLRYDINQGTAPGVLYDSAAAAYLPVAIHPDVAYKWCYDSATNQIREQAGYDTLPTGQSLDVSYMPGFPQYLLVTDAAERAAVGIWLRKETATDIETYAEALVFAEAHIRRYKARPKGAHLVTLLSGCEPGQTATVNLPDLQVSSESFLVTEVEADYQRIRGGSHVEYTLTLVGGSEYQDSWVDYWKNLGSGSSASSGTVSGSGGGGTESTAALRIFLGGSRSEGVQHSTSTPAPNYVVIELDGDDVPGGTASVLVDLMTADAGTSVTPRLYNITDSVVAGTGSATASTTWETQVFGVTLASGAKRYRLELTPSNASAMVFGIGTLQT